MYSIIFAEQWAYMFSQLSLTVLCYKKKTIFNIEITLKLLVDIGKKVQNGTLDLTVINEIIVVCL